MKKENLQVSVPYEITLLSNNAGVESRLDEFQYLMKLHYSQTKYLVRVQASRFQYLMKLHYSQTASIVISSIIVSVPYEITLLSNIFFNSRCANQVSVPYEITLLSNFWLGDFDD